MIRPKLMALRRRRGMLLGTAPGTLVIDPTSSKPRVSVMAYGPEGCVEDVVSEVATLKAYLERWPVTWVNVDGLGDLETLHQLGELFRLHRLALEDVLSLHQRPKVEEYGDLLFIIARMIEPSEPVQTEQLGIFLGSRFVLTFQERVGDCFDPIRKRIREGETRMRSSGPDYLAYSLLDSIVDAYFPYLDVASDRLDALEDEALYRPRPLTVSSIHQAKRDLLVIRRVISAKREVVNTLFRYAGPCIAETTRIYLRDCYDQLIQLMDTLDIHRELAASLMEVYLSSVSNRMNAIMKMLTLIATMFIPLTFLAGVYGMNFDPEASPWNMPELRFYWGYPGIVALMAAILLLELILFWRKGWLSGSEAETGRDDRHRTPNASLPRASPHSGPNERSHGR